MMSTIVNFFSSKGGQHMVATPTPITKETLLEIIKNVENDPLAGLGSLSKRDILIDRLLAHIRVTQPPPHGEAAALLTEPLLLTKEAA